jgi:hypothetical protein
MAKSVVTLQNVEPQLLLCQNKLISFCTLKTGQSIQRREIVSVVDSRLCIDTMNLPSSNLHLKAAEFFFQFTR